jgi:DNA-binding response OmpR family regulator
MPKNILLVDDDAGVRETLGQLLKSENYAVTLAKTGRDAAAKFFAELPDLVLLDLNMPDRDGWDVYGLMHQTHPLVPVIVITAESQQYKRASECGVDALMEKPLDIPLLLEAIQGYLDESETERDRRLNRQDFKTVSLKELASKSSQYESG